VKEVRLQLRDNVLKRVFAEVSQIHESRNTSGKLNQLFLNEFALRLVFLLLVAQLLLLVLCQPLPLLLALEFLDLLILVDDRLNSLLYQSVNSKISGYASNAKEEKSDLSH
jgi:hypothetical protein